MYLSPSFQVFDAPTDDIGWFVLQEYRNDLSWDAPLAGGGYTPRSEQRNEVEIKKINGQLYMGVVAKYPIMQYPPEWDVFPTDFPLPFGKWITQEIYIKEGDNQTGRFYLALTVDGIKHVIVDQAMMTASPATGYTPDGLTSWGPMKVYTEGRVIDWFKNQGKTMDVYWDDLEIWFNAQPEDFSGGGGGTNLITNPGFEDGMTGWTSWNDASTTVSFGSITSGSNQVCRAYITNGGASDWYIQLMQALPVTAGKKYNITFKASSYNNRNIGFMFQSPAGTWKTESGIAITPTLSTYGPYTFDCTTTDANNKFRFMLGGNDNSVYIDDVVIEEAPSGNLITNSGFEDGMTDWTTWNDASTTVSFGSITSGSNQVCRAYITNGGTTNWHIQLMQSLPITAGKTYDITFKALSYNNRNIGFMFQSPAGTWKTESSIAITPTLSTYGPYTFDCTTTDANNKFRFLLGGNDNSVYIDDVVITEATTKSAIIGEPEVVNDNISMYPNPVADVLKVNISAIAGEQVLVQVFDLQGRSVISKNFVTSNSGSNTFDLAVNNLSNGIFMVKVVAGNISKSTMIIVQK
ncbi:MAG: carbohydrate binding domain-containing protein [Salinivirgaceae bacterium]|nr:carbohydrate binding domain-containing protein [Salinivirgaceae bacterium]